MIIVPYSVGSATPSQIAFAADKRDFTCTFVLDSEDSQAISRESLLRSFCTVVITNTLHEVLKALPSKPSAIVTFAERSIPMAAALADRFRLPGHSASTMLLLIDKAAQRGRLNAEGVGFVESVNVRSGKEVPQRVPLPGALMPCVGAASRNTYFVDDIGQLEAALGELDPEENYVVEKRLVGALVPLDDWRSDYVSVESAVIEGRITHLGITGRLPVAKPAREVGLIFPVALSGPFHGPVIELATAAIHALEIRTGLCHTEIKLTPTGPQIIEVNARLGGGLWSIMPRAGFIDPVSLAIDIACGYDLPVLPWPNRVAIHLYIQPPQNVFGLAAAPDPRHLRKLTGVYGVDRRVEVGDAVDWRTGSLGRILDVWIEGASLADLRRNVEDVNAYVLESTEWICA